MFFKANQEFKACGGQRAVCLCTFPKVGAPLNQKEKIVLASPAAEQSNSGSGAVRDFVLMLDALEVLFSKSCYDHRDAILYSNLIVKSLDPVPKV